MLPTIANLTGFSSASPRKKRPYSKIFYLNQRGWDCLESFALNVPACFASEFSTLCKNTPHSADFAVSLKHYNCCVD